MQYFLNFVSYISSSCGLGYELSWVVVPRGWLLIAEVKSRLDPNTGGADPNKFLKAICELGFTIESKVSINSFLL